MAGSVRSLWPPYVAAVVLGLVGNGVGASGLLARVTTALGMELAPEATARHAYHGSMAAKGANPLAWWIVVEVIGIAIGAQPAAVAAGRFLLQLDDTGKIRAHAHIIGPVRRRSGRLRLVYRRRRRDE